MHSVQQRSKIRRAQTHRAEQAVTPPADDPNHILSLNPFAGRTFASCSCGWRGNLQDDDAGAQVQHAAHRAES